MTKALKTLAREAAIIVVVACAFYAFATMAGAFTTPHKAPVHPAPTATAQFAEPFDGPVCMVQSTDGDVDRTSAQTVNEWAGYGYLTDHGYFVAPMDYCRFFPAPIRTDI